MSDPVLDEEGILELLTMPVSSQTVSALQAGAVQAMIDLYDRKVTRDEFIHSIAPCINLYGQLAKLWLLSNVKAVHATGDLDADRFEKAEKGLVDMVKLDVDKVTQIVKRLTECPTSKDQIN